MFLRSWLDCLVLDLLVLLARVGLISGGQCGISILPLLVIVAGLTMMLLRHVMSYLSVWRLSSHSLPLLWTYFPYLSGW
jgi:hypothetical protein